MGFENGYGVIMVMEIWNLTKGVFGLHNRLLKIVILLFGTSYFYE
jgi:hypothetical protein